MDAIYLIGRILFGAIFLFSGISHFAKADAMAAYAGAKGLPAPKLATLVSGAMLLAGALSVLLGVYMEIGSWLLLFFVLSAAFTMHAFWKVADPMMRSVEQAQFMKNVSMAGGALILYWLVKTYGYGPLTLGTPMG